MRLVTFILLSAVFIFCFHNSGSAQNDVPTHPTLIGNGEFRGISPPLRDLPAVTAEEFAAMKEKALKKAANKKIEPRIYPFAETALPKGPDAAWQKAMGKSQGPKAPIVNFEGQTTSSFPPDCNGTAGPNHYMQTVNTTYSIYTKTGTLVAGPTNMNLLFGTVPGANCNDGDPLIQYDEQAGRWLAVEFSLCGSNDLMLIAVSTTNDPTGTWYQYSFDVADMPDYEKIGVWQDGYYMGTNNSSGNDIYVFERSKMLLGQTAQMVGFNNAWRPGTGFLCVPPLDNDGIAAPAGTPGMFIAFNDDAVAGGTDQLWLYELAVNWTTPSSSTFTRSQQIDVIPFDSQFTPSWDDITQPNSQKLDGVPQVIMNAPQYRNFGSYQTIVCCHTVDVDATNHAGIRWYELRKTAPATLWDVRQQSTFAPDIHSRWMGSIMLNGSGKIGMGYSVSSSTIYPGIRYCGQSASAYAGATSVLDIPEEVIHNGTVAQTTYNRWGDYALLSVDPADDQTFWFTSEYVKTGGTNKGSKIASFKFGNDPAVVTLAATLVTGTSATINGTVNPNGLATTYYFEWGTTPSYGNTTTTASAGSGTTAVAVSANLISLTGGTTYHFRLAGTNSDGTSYGSDLTFTPGGAVVTTAVVTAINQTTATSGGTVTSDGGSTVTGRGVCWASTANPTTSGSHTIDGAGMGTFSSSIIGLSSNTLYHVRAYAINANGTFYGNDVTFTTLCGIVNTFPWNEGFENGGLIPSCWTQEQVNSSGISWTFVAGNGSGYPAAAHGGSFNACLKDNSTADNKTRLITPSINLSLASSPTLTFWHTQALWSPDQDVLTVYYRTSATGTWTQLATYTSNIAAWTQETISLPNASADYYINFEGNAKYGRGICLDDVSITGSTSPSLSVTPPNQNVTASAGAVQFTVASNSAWTVLSDQTWCTVTPSGTGNGTITANYTQNILATSRVANVSVTVSGLPMVIVTVSQAGTIIPTLSVIPPNQNVAAPAGTVQFTVASNSPWTVLSDQTWCIVPPSGTGNGSITATYSQNILTTSRVANISVTVAGLAPVVVTVTQAGEALMISVVPPVQNVSAPSGTTLFTVTSNAPWTASSDQTWCLVTTSGTGNGTIQANYTENTSLTSRAANITVTVAGISPVVVMVNQLGVTPMLSVTPPNQNVGPLAGGTNFTVTTNSSWTASSDQGWCVVTPSGTGSGDLTATYQENVSVNQRVANITVLVNGIGPVVVTVTQAGVFPSLLVTPDNRNVTVAAGTTNFSVSSNSNWMANSNVPWCTVTFSGSGNGTIDAVYQQNTGLNPRTAIITVNIAGLAPVTVTVSQEGTVGMSEKIQRNIVLFPNPNKGKFTISAADHSLLKMDVEVLTMDGKAISKVNCTGRYTYTFDLSAQPRGSYLVRIVTAEGTALRTVIME